MTLSDRVAISELLAEYGALLTDKQRDMLSMYCEMDLSLSEIATEYQVSRQAVRDSMQRAIASLEEYESKLGYVRLRSEISALLTKVDESNWKDAIAEIASKLEV